MTLFCKKPTKGRETACVPRAMGMCLRDETKQPRSLQMYQGHRGDKPASLPTASSGPGAHSWWRGLPVWKSHIPSQQALDPLHRPRDPCPASTSHWLLRGCHVFQLCPPGSLAFSQDGTETLGHRNLPPPPEWGGEAPLRSLGRRPWWDGSGVWHDTSWGAGQTRFIPPSSCPWTPVAE